MYAKFLLELLSILSAVAPDIATEIQAIHASPNGAGKVNAAAQGLAHLSAAITPLVTTGS